MKYCPYRGKDFPDSEPFNEEHVIPLSIGGPTSLCIQVSTDANSRFGTEVDSPLVNSFFIKQHRHKHHLPGQSGNIPDIEFKGTLQNLDTPVPARFSIGVDRTKIWLKPTVEYVTGEDGRQSVKIGASSEDELLQIIKNINKKNTKKGLNPIDTATALNKANYNHISTPEMEAQMSIDVTSFSRAFVKMALGLAHFAIGEPYSRSEGADLLRKFLWESDPEKRKKIPLHGQTFPFYNDVKMKNILSIADRHVIGILNGDPPTFFASLFGEYMGVVSLSNSYNETIFTTIPADGVIWVIEPSSRSVASYSLGEFIFNRQSSILPPISKISDSSA